MLFSVSLENVLSLLELYDNIIIAETNETMVWLIRPCQVAKSEYAMRPPFKEGHSSDIASKYLHEGYQTRIQMNVTSRFCWR